MLFPTLDNLSDKPLNGAVTFPRMLFPKDDTDAIAPPMLADMNLNIFVGANVIGCNESFNCLNNSSICALS